MTDIVSTDNSAAEILRRFGPDPYPSSDPEYVDMKFWEWACEGMLKVERKWRQSGQVFSWIDERPDWLSVTDWHFRDILPNPDHPCTRTLRLALVGGGQIRITEEYVWLDHKTPADPIFGVLCHWPQLRVQAETEEGLYTATAIIDGAFCEMDAEAVVFHRKAPQVIADRVATTFRLVRDRTDLMALLTHSRHCGCCGRALDDEVSKLIGIGPTCARKWGFPHNIVTANRVLERRRELLGDRH